MTCLFLARLLRLSRLSRLLRLLRLSRLLRLAAILTSSTGTPTPASGTATGTGTPTPTSGTATGACHETFRSTQLRGFRPLTLRRRFCILRKFFSKRLQFFLMLDHLLTENTVFTISNSCG